MSIASFGTVVSSVDQTSSPVAASSANALVGVAPKTLPASTVTPLGPWSGSSIFVSQIVSPVFRFTATTFDSRSCM